MRLSTLMLIRNAFKVQRFHTMITHSADRVGGHTANMIALAMWFEDGRPSLNLLKAVLYHDVPEAITGDVPAPLKWDFPEVAAALEKVENRIIELHDLGVELDDREKVILKFTDYADLVLKGLEELELGNDVFAVVVARGMQQIENLRGSHIWFAESPKVKEWTSLVLSSAFVQPMEEKDEGKASIYVPTRH